MKKLIVAAIILMATTVAWADMKEDVFKYLQVADISHIKETEPGTSLGVTTMDINDFKMSAQEFFRNNENYFVLQPWTSVSNSFCIAFTDLKTIYAMCVDGKIIVLKEVK